MQSILFFTAAFLMVNIAYSSVCDGFYKGVDKCRQAESVIEKYKEGWLASPGVSGVILSVCRAGIPEAVHKGSAPDLPEEACVSITFKDEESQNYWRQRFGGQSTEIDEIVVFFGPIRESVIEPGFSAHN